MSDSTGLKLGALLSTTTREGPGRGYPRALREKVARYVSARREQGATCEQLAAELGVPANTLLRWSHAFAKSTSNADAGAFRRVQLADARARAMTLHGPCGLRVEGLDLDTLVALWKRLAS